MTSRSANFGAFLGAHSAIARQLSNNPSLANDQNYLQSHPELQSYLSTHPEVRNELIQNPQGFVKSAQELNGATNKTNTPPAATAPPPTATPSQPNQQPKH
jgi:predicted N-formylglutamate amidohydrolase